VGGERLSFLTGRLYEILEQRGTPMPEWEIRAQLLDEHLAAPPFEFQVGTPREDARRGGHGQDR